MTTYYISPNGSDANNGLGPDASAATNKPYLTLGKAMNTGSAVVAGDTVYIAPGYYYSGGNITPLSTISSVGSPTQFIGDPTNAQGFKDGSGVRLAPGLPWVTTRTSGEGLESPIASANNVFMADVNNGSGFQFKFLVFEAKHTTQTIWLFGGAAGSDNLFQDCYLIANSILQSTAGAPTAGRNTTLRRCTLLCGVALNWNQTTAAATADANLGILVEECLIIGRLSNNLAFGASGGNIGGGVSFYDCTVIGDCGGNSFLSSVALRVSTVNPIKVGSCRFVQSVGVVFNAGTTGQLIDDGNNRISQMAGSAYTNTTQAGTSILGIAPNMVLPHLVTWGLEMPRHDFLGWSDAAHANQAFSASGRTTPDFRGRTARPWGAGSSIGCFQAQAVVQDTTSAITGGGVNSLKLTGAGEVSVYIPVDATGFTVTVTTKSTSYGGTNYPQMVVVANPSVGVTSDTTVTASSASEQAITTATITPTSKGVMEVRLISRSSSVSSVTYFDILTNP